MSNKMLIDSSHPEETRVVVTKGNRLEDFDFESQHKRQIRGNIYLAKVTRVEPSLQAAFVDYGGNRHGFLAFSEIHPDYYQIPLADRQALVEEEAALANAEEADDDAEAEARSQNKGRGRGRRRRGRKDDRNGRGRNRGDYAKQSVPDAEPVAFDALLAIYEERMQANNGEHAFVEAVVSVAAAIDNDDVISEDTDLDTSSDDDDDSDDSDTDDDVDVVADDDDAIEDSRPRRRSSRKQYKIQEVIKRRQVILVQVVKEERGNKGAALTTYMSLAGRYSVLMPNTARGGGISRKITNADDRRRLKDMVKDLEVPKGMGVILRTAGANRTRGEVKRDYEYLMRLWDNVRDLTLSSSAPSLVYEEGNLIKRSIRDLFNKDINEITVAGEEGFRQAKDFMRMLMPGSAKLVKPWQDPSPIFARTGMEAQLDKLMSPQVTLKSGGYIIINQTEALVAIDVNSGKSTREHSIEETAIATNLEAAEEVARQLRLRDLAGLIVVDFIDMEENRNNRAVEKKLKDCLKNDRARIQVGRISHFGLLEMSRQRMRASVLESTMQVCEHCQGTGLVRSAQSVALHVIRSIEDYLIRNDKNHVTVRTPGATALYLLNDKRESLIDMEQRFGLKITVEIDDSVGADMVAIDRGEVSNLPKRAPTHVTIDYDDSEDENYVETVEDGDDEILIQNAIDEDSPNSPRNDDENQGNRKRRRRRGKKNRDNNGDDTQNASADDESDDNDSDDNDGNNGRGKRRRRSRGRRGGRGRKNRQDRIPNAELVGPMIEFAAAWDAANSKSENEPSSNDDNGDQQASGSPDQDGDNQGNGKNRNRRKRGRGRGRNRHENGGDNNANDTGDNNSGDNGNNGGEKQIAASNEAADNQQPQANGAAAQPEAQAEPVKADADEKPALSKREEIAVEVAREEAPENSDEAPKRVRATEANINHDVEPVVVSKTGDKPKPKKGGWWARKLLG
ncbi:Rne/Rng family ribonuclease [Ahrensia marina]|uniref:Ribonuclease E n=1 Tax=Ahrensia marina TaxID=1514904 RepID=A0A0M9GN41_9HYPH|nr:ribonuclease E/G [Ahrensia marina]KPB01680.1 ribonuclease [Ahrensia marina]